MKNDIQCIDIINGKDEVSGSIPDDGSRLSTDLSIIIAQSVERPD